jgi:hypothetical protein
MTSVNFPWTRIATSVLLGFKVLTGLTVTCTLPVQLVVGQDSAIEAAAELTERETFFEKKVRPLLAQSCIKCHGSEKQEGGLRLDTLEFMKQGGDSGPAIAPGAVADSLIISAIRYEDFEMPPSGQLPEESRAILETWVEKGAVWPSHGGEGGLVIRSPGGVSEEDKEYWAFQPLAQVAVPDIANSPQASRALTPIDAFIIQQLDTHELALAPEADRRTLIRRLYFDLIGVPPSVAEVESFLTSDDPQAYEKMVDRLLDDTRYGEKWARHWLDLVRYAESDGFNQDAARPTAYLYRDWVIAAFNSDMPYDRFVLEQLAGDEIDSDNADSLLATGFLRHYIYEYNQRDVRTQWNNILNDLTDVTGEVFFGLGVGCARCHDHKFDPILQRDYYRLQASFATFLPVDGLPYGTKEALQSYREKFEAWQSATEDLRKQIEEIEGPVKERIANTALEKFPLDVRPILRKAAKDRDGYEEQIAALAHRQVLEEWNKLDFSKSLKDEQKAKWEGLQAQLKEFEAIKPQPMITMLAAGNVAAVPPPTKIPQTKDDNPVKPASFEVQGALDIQNWEGEQSTKGRRTALANWINSVDNPLPHRVIVNRIWQYHFGTGIVQNASDFGRLGFPPTNPELLDWLARWFLDNGRSFKQLHRLIVCSATYMQSSQNSEIAVRGNAVDLPNHWLWHYPARRMEAEQIRDAMLVASGKIDWRTGGPADDHLGFRRSVYTMTKRNKPHPILVTFDAPDGNASVAKRNITTTPIQSLLLANFDWPLSVAHAMAADLRREKAEVSDLIQLAYLRALQRSPSPAELGRALTFLQNIRQDDAKTKAIESGNEDLSGLADLCHMLFNSSEFMYLD